jgi:hypothetical protein
MAPLVAGFAKTLVLCSSCLGFLVPVRGYAKEGDAENVEFVGIAA